MKLNHHFYLALLFMALISSGMVRSQIVLEETEVDTATVIYGLDIPWEIQWGPDDHLWVTERFGRVSRVNPQTGAQDVILDISGIVEQSGESGLLGMALHPDFQDTSHVFLVYTYLDGPQIQERVVKYEYDGTQLVNEVILLDGIRGSYNHNGSRLVISPGYKLFVTTGDALVQAASQDPEDLSGKILRLNLDGSVPADNPFPDNPVWTLGHRNPQGLLLAPNGILYSSEHGPSTDDELNIILEGRNYGWPYVKGFCDQPDEVDFCTQHQVKEPLVAWTPTVAASDIVYYDHPSIPEWQGSILMTTLKNKRLYEIGLDDNGTQSTGQNEYFTELWGRLRDICISPDGAVYLATNGDSWSNTQPFTHRIVKIWNPDYLTSDGVEENLDKRVTLSPNPITDRGMIRLNEAHGTAEYRIYGLGGRVMQQGIINGSISISKGDLTSGIYVLEVHLENSIHTQKIVIL